jgi:hypothetical protein
LAKLKESVFSGPIRTTEKSHTAGSTIYRANCDGSNPEIFISGLSEPADLLLDQKNRLIYWSDFNSSVIHRATTEGTNSTNFITGQDRVRDIEIADGFIYWCDRDFSQVKRRALDGAGGGSVLFSGGSLDWPL